MQLYGHGARAADRQEVLAHSWFYSVRGSENSSPFWRARRIIVGRTEPRRLSYMDTRDMSGDGMSWHASAFRCAALFSGLRPRVPLAALCQETREEEKTKERQEEEEDAAHVAVIVLMGQIASVANELFARGRLPWHGRRVYHARPFDQIALVKPRNWIEC